MGRFDGMKKKFDPDRFLSWTKERAPYGRIAILEGIHDILEAIGRLFRG